MRVIAKKTYRGFRGRYNDSGEPFKPWYKDGSNASWKTPIATSLIFLLLVGSIYGQKFQDLAKTPPMGWNSWNYFECDNINEQVIKDMADAMVSSGM